MPSNKGGYMSFLQLTKKRYSVRAYKPDPVEGEKLKQILEAARMAPTACNLQPFRLIVIHTKGKEAELKHIYSTPWFVQAPIVICICGIPSHGWFRRDGRSYCDVNVIIAIDHLIFCCYKPSTWHLLDRCIRSRCSTRCVGIT